LAFYNKGIILTITKEFVVLEINRLIDLKNRLAEIEDISTKTGNEDSYKEIVSECDFLIAGLYTLINPKKDFGEFNKKMSDKDFIEYVAEFATNLEKDLKGEDNV
jgi:hypothetical protein